jgi:hypothetical protein
MWFRYLPPVAVRDSFVLTGPRRIVSARRVSARKGGFMTAFESVVGNNDLHPDAVEATARVALLARSRYSVSEAPIR